MSYTSKKIFYSLYNTIFFLMCNQYLRFSKIFDQQILSYFFLDFLFQFIYNFLKFYIFLIKSGGGTGPMKPGNSFLSNVPIPAGKNA